MESPSTQCSICLKCESGTFQLTTITNYYERTSYSKSINVCQSCYLDYRQPKTCCGCLETSNYIGNTPSCSQCYRFVCNKCLDYAWNTDWVIILCPGCYQTSAKPCEVDFHESTTNPRSLSYQCRECKLTSCQVCVTTTSCCNRKNICHKCLRYHQTKIGTCLECDNQVYPCNAIRCGHNNFLCRQCRSRHHNYTYYCKICKDTSKCVHDRVYRCRYYGTSLESSECRKVLKKRVCCLHLSGWSVKKRLGKICPGCDTFLCYSCNPKQLNCLRCERAAGQIAQWYKKILYHPDSSYVTTILSDRFYQLQPKLMNSNPVS